MNKRVYLRLLTIGLREIIMYQIWYDYIKPKYGVVIYGYRHCICITFIAYIKTDDIYINISLYL